MNNRLNFDTILDIGDFTRYLNNLRFNCVDVDTVYDVDCVVDLLSSCPFFVSRFKDRPEFCVKASPDDLFVQALAKLRDNGDIDCLVRSLSWQQNDIAFLSNELKNYERTLVSLDSSLRKIAKLKDDAVKLRKRNGELLTTIQKLRDSNKLLKSVVYEKKNSCKSR